MKRTTMIAVLVLLAAPFAIAQNAGMGMPPGQWWRMPRVVEKLKITPDQQGKLDKVFDGAAPQLIDLRAEMQKKAMALRQLLDAKKLDRAAISEAADALSAARSRIFNREMMMMVDMRAVLDDTQWTELRQALEQRGQRPRGERKPGNQMRRPPQQQDPQQNER